MKKIVNKILISFFLSFIFITGINAEEDVCAGEGEFLINKQSDYIQCGPWNVPVYVCNPTTVTESTDYIYDSPSAAQKSCEGSATVAGYKESYVVYFPQCDLSAVGKRINCSWRDYSYTSLGTDGKCPAGFYRYGGSCRTFIGSGSSNYDNTDNPSSACLAEHTSCTCGSPKYNVTYVRFVCKPRESKKYITNGFCQAAYSTRSADSGNVIPAYCVNPDNIAPKKSIIENVDATACGSSNVTKDCGMSNILIEGYYRYYTVGNHKYTYNVILAALQLWGSHVGLKGYEKTGIADIDNSNNTKEFEAELVINHSCPTGCTYLSADSERKLPERCRCKENKILLMPDPRPVNDEYIYRNVFKETLTNLLDYYTNRNGTVEDITTNFKYKSNDTGLGLKEIICNSNGNYKMGVMCRSTNYSGMTNDYLYAVALYLNTIQGNPDMQKHLNEINSTASGQDMKYFESNDPLSVDGEIVSETTDILVTYHLEEGVEIDCNYLEGENLSACEQEQVITVRDSNGNILVDSLEFNHYDYCKKNFCYVTIDKRYIGKVLCDKEDKYILEVTTTVKRKCGAGSVKKYIPCGNTDDFQTMFTFEPDPHCTDTTETGREETMSSEILCNNCKEGASINKENCSNIMNNIVTRKVSDPSLNCILHKASSDVSNVNNKSYYDYSSDFKVNTDFCRVYCSDDIEYKLAGKTEVYIGLQLKYDIESKVFNNRTNKNSNALTSIVLLKRNCVSKIFYDDFEFESIPSIRRKYGLTKDEAKDIKNWKTLYKVILEKTTNENDRKEVINQLVYDLYNCNFYSTSNIGSLRTADGIKITKPKNSTNALASALNYLNNSGEGAKVNITYQGGTEYSNYSSTTYTRVGESSVDPIISSDVRKGNNITVKYCDKANCFRGDYNHDSSFEEDYSKASGIGNRNTNYYIMIPETIKFNKTGTDTISVPTNDYAIFTLSSEIDFYNSTRYEVQSYTGRVKPYNSQTDIDGELESNPQAVFLNKNLYPISIYSTTLCKNSLCDITHQYKITSFARKNTEDLLSKANKDISEYKCKIKVSSNVKEGEYQFAYKNIDLNNPFPTLRTYSNWSTEQAKDVISEIKQSGASELYATEEYLEYSFILDGNAIKNIREYNSTRTYADGLLTNCTLINNKFFNCSSDFIQNLKDPSTNYGIVVNKGDGISDYTNNKLEGGD